MNPVLYQRIFFPSKRLKHTWIKPKGFDTGIKVYNCIAKEKVPLIVGNQNFTSWYTCGPTVYDSAHIGHASCYMKLDIIQRILREYFKINLITVMNVTDIDDKIIKKSLESKSTPTEIARYYEKEFWEDMQSLKIVKPNLILRVTENIQLITKFIDKLLRKKDGYKTNDGVLFDIKANEVNYGKLQNINPKGEDTNSNNSVNFTMWKVAKENEPYWSTDCGVGRPGWHTECAALASAVFGSTLDIHAGGIDLRFPHHENEEIQCCAYFTTAQWVNYWFHTGHLLQNSTKMSKSLSNTLTIRNMLHDCEPDVFRVMCLMSHYRNNMEFSKDYVQSAQNIFDILKNFLNTCDLCLGGKLNPTLNNDILYANLMESIEKVNFALRDDFDTASCLKTLSSLISTTNVMLHSASTTAPKDLKAVASLIAVRNFVTNTFYLFGVDLERQLNIARNQDNEAFDIVNILTNFRQDIRELGILNKDNTILKLCDNVRDDLKKCGIHIKDHGIKASSWTK